MECVCQKQELIITGKCARKECGKDWTRTLTDSEEIKSECRVCRPLFCGGHVKVCIECESEGYIVSSGSGNGKTYVHKQQPKESKIECVCQKKELVITGKCAIRECRKDWTRTLIDPEEIKSNCRSCRRSFCGGRYKTCIECENEGYTAASGKGDGNIYIYKNLQCIDVFKTTELYKDSQPKKPKIKLDHIPKTNKPGCVCQKEELVIIDKCARRECRKDWTRTLTDPIEIQSECPTCRFCGTAHRVCIECEDEGYHAVSGIGDGNIYIYKNGKEVDTFPEKRDKDGCVCKQKELIITGKCARDCGKDWTRTLTDPKEIEDECRECSPPPPSWAKIKRVCRECESKGYTAPISSFDDDRWIF